MSDKAIHPFTNSGLGDAPFQFVGVTERRGPITVKTTDGATVQVGAPGQPMGTCAHCGMGIAICCHIVSADGNRFEVGSVCVNKTHDAKLIHPVKREINARRRALKRKRDLARIKRAGERMAGLDAHEILSERPHPYGFDGMTAWDFCCYMMQNAGITGKLRAARMIEDALADI